MNPNLLLILAGGGLSLVLLLLFFWGDEKGSGSYKKRLARVSGEAPAKVLKQETPGSLRRKTSDSDIPLFDKLIKTFLPNPQKLRQRLERTGKDLSLGNYLVINGISILVFFFGFSVFGGWSKPISFFLGIAVGLYLPHMVTGSMGDRRVKKFLDNFPEAIDTMCRGLRSGLPITEMIQTVGRELPEPLATEFTRIGDSVRMGRTLEESMWDVEPRLNTPEFRFFIIALSIQRETGGNLAETLGNLGELLRKRRQLRLKIRAMSSEAKASAMIIGSLPFIMFTLLMVVNSDYVLTLIRDPRGNFLFGFAICWLGMGVLTMKQMIHFDI